jgi:hypothetical protein
MALLDTPQAMYGNMTSQYQLMQHPYGRHPGYPAYYEQEAALAARFNIQRLQATSTSPEFPRPVGLKEEAVAPITVLHSSSSSNNTPAFRPYSSPGQENLPHHQTTQLHAKVF